MRHYLLLAISFVLMLSCQSQGSEKNSSDTKVEENAAGQTGQSPQTGSAIPSGAITIAQAKAMHESGEYVFIDLRTPEEVAASGKIEGAIEMNTQDADFKKRLQQLDGRNPIVFYCAGGNRSGRVYQMADIIGFSRIYDMTDGYDAWKASEQE